MIKHLLAKSAIAALLAAGAMAASAQVSVYGTVDVGVARQKTDGTGAVTGVASGARGDNVLGFRGTEDLGGGLKGSFTLESGFNVDDGSFETAGKIFSRESSLGLQSHYGSIKLGQVKSLSAAHAEGFDAFGGAGIGIARDLFDNAGRYVGNTVVAGTSFGSVGINASYTFGEQAGSASAGSTTAIGATYGVGPLKVGVTHTDFDGAGKSTQFGAAYDLKVVSLFGNYETDSGRAVDNAYSLGFKAPLASNVTAIASFGKREFVGTGTEKSFAAGLDYSLSKRTTVYSGFKQVDADGTKSNAVALGVNHKF